MRGFGAAGASRARRNLLWCLGIASAVLALAASLAAAHFVTTFHPEGSYATMSSSHDLVWACDQDPDGNYVYIRRVIGGVVQPAIYDSDGYGGGCGQVGINAATLDSFNVCVQNEGCGNPIYRGQY